MFTQTLNPLGSLPLTGLVALVPVILLLVLGLFSFGLVAMIAYVIAGPEGTRESEGRTFHAPA